MIGTDRRLLLLAVLALVTAGASLLVGPVSTPDAAIIREIRLPRIILGMLVGFGLAGSGTVFQAVLRNPLADPYILGTSGAAFAGVMTASVLGFQHFTALYAAALGFALASVVLVYRIASSDGRTPVQTLILAGVVVGLFCNAAVFIFFALHYRESMSVLFHLLGTLTEGSSVLIAVSGSLVLVGLAASWAMSKDLNLLTQGEEPAFHLGLNVERAKWVLFVIASTMVAACVAIAGMIGFVGLIIPHMMRMLVGADHRRLIPASALGGAVFLLWTDAMARTLAAPLEIPIGALTALLGSPYFIYLLRRHRSRGF